jgi:hypothetical protein
MSGAIGVVALIVVGVGVIVFGRLKNDVERAFARSYLLFIAAWTGNNGPAARKPAARGRSFQTVPMGMFCRRRKSTTR